MIFYHCKDIGNFGDKAAKYIYERITGKPSQYCYNINEQKHFFITGSILKDATDKTTVLGAGFGSRDVKLKTKPTIKMVRGHITRAMLIEQGFKKQILCGDPVRILPKLYLPKVEKKYKLGIIPHYIDQKLSRVQNFPQEHLYIDILGNIETVIQQVLSCKTIISSSLHGIILPHAYGIPARWVKFSDKIAGDDMKYFDYFTSVGINQTYLDCRSKIPNNIQIPPETGILKDDIFTLLKRELK